MSASTKDNNYSRVAEDEVAKSVNSAYVTLVNKPWMYGPTVEGSAVDNYWIRA